MKSRVWTDHEIERLQALYPHRPTVTEGEMTMKRLTRYAGLIAGASLLTAGLGGCENGAITLTDEARAMEKAKVAKQGDARVALFRECMTFATKIPRQADDDVSDIVQECSRHAGYMTDYVQ